jgi:flagellar biosynthetic protein FliR
VNFSVDTLLTMISVWFFPFLRIGAMFMTMPVIGSKLVSSQTRLLLSVLVSVAVVPLVTDVPQTIDLNLNTLVLILRELIVGFSLGFSFQMLFQVFSLGGQLMAMKMGLGFAMMNDPASGVQTTVLSQFFLIMSMLVFVSVDGHLYLISTVVESFKTLPLAEASFSPKSYISIVHLLSWVFVSALVFALPIITSLLFVNIAFGVMSRAAPQLNIFAVGFPFTLLCGLLLVWVGLDKYLDSFDKSSSYMFEFVHGMLKIN